MPTMTQQNLGDRARRYLGCHPNADLVVTDAWEINPNHHECEVMCSRCKRTVHVDISRAAYRHMDNRQPYLWKQEGQ